jgi:molybdate transport repressor ModE-like protein
MKLLPVIDWKLAAGAGDDARALDARLLPLLAAVANGKSLAAAVAECAISYRSGWGLLREYESLLGAPLVQLERGRGASLTPLGTAFLQAQKIAERRLETVLPGFMFDLSPEPATAPPAALHQLRVAASHDLVLASLAASLPQLAPQLALQIDFQGSLRALQTFAGGDADLAGFHVPSGGKPSWNPADFRRFLNVRNHRLIRFIEREQGLILPKGNPARVRSLRDVAMRGLRFVNRQRGSGTRLLIDRLLTDSGIASAAIAGYGQEEFTHAAVAATVASGGADAGFGLRAAAHEFGLDFISLVREQYFLAVRTRDLEHAGVEALLHLLHSASFAQHVRRFAGCSAADAGVVDNVGVLGGD